MNEGICPLCSKQSNNERHIQNDTWSVTCERCGVFTITDQALGTISLYDTNQKAKISCYTKTRTISNNKKYTIVSDYYSKFNDTDDNTVSLENMLNNYPKVIHDRINRTLLNLNYLAKFTGDIVSISPPENLYYSTYSLNGTEFSFFINALRELNYVKFLDKDNLSEIEIYSHRIQITILGYQKLDEITIGKNSIQGFIAMCQNQKFLPDWKIIQDEGIYKGIEDARFVPFPITEHEFNGDMHDEIIAQIRRSRFVVADLTGARQNVYYEAGFAEGLGIPVIYTCKKE